ncbi:DUF4232 domain-containing protein [Streptomyces sp. NPDC085639]|uniref:DUF4232 domain-containing protein n=1 Tax=Streptomyces sp. NPDC085639 TaxID=3365734 RepID=UPI0037D5BCF5
MHTSWRTYSLAAAALAALLSSTACNPGLADPKNPTPSGSASGASAAPGTKSPTQGSAAPPTAPTATPAGAVACNDNDLSITTSVWRQDSGQHLLVTATNFTDKTCTLYHYPYIGFGAVIEGPIDAMGSAPRAIATIGPKEKAYAGLFLFRGSEPTVAVEAVSIGYQDRALNSNKESAMLDVALSKEIGSLNVGTNARVTYWNRDLGAIEDFLFRSGTR